MKGRFKFVVPSFNSVKFLPKTLHSIETQEFDEPYDVCIIDDASTLPQQKKIIQEFCARNNWKAIYHENNEGALKSILDGINRLNCQDEDIIIRVDGDDWLADNQVLNTLKEAYEKSDTYLTYGSFTTFPPNCTNITYAAPTSEEVIQNQLYRSLRWIFGHPYTFKFHLWKRIQDKDLRDENGNYYGITSDRAIFYPMLEMAGRHIKFIERILYVYNLENPISDYAIAREEQVKAELRIKALPKYPAL